MLQQQSGQRSAAEATLARILRFHPDLGAARELLARVRASSR
jgi:hypothetical protein